MIGSLNEMPQPLPLSSKAHLYSPASRWARSTARLKARWHRRRHVEAEPGTSAGAPWALKPAGTTKRGNRFRSSASSWPVSSPCDEARHRRHRNAPLDLSRREASCGAFPEQSRLSRLRAGSCRVVFAVANPTGQVFLVLRALKRALVLRAGPHILRVRFRRSP